MEAQPGQPYQKPDKYTPYTLGRLIHKLQDRIKNWQVQERLRRRERDYYKSRFMKMLRVINWLHLRNAKYFNVLDEIVADVNKYKKPKPRINQRGIKVEQIKTGPYTIAGGLPIDTETGKPITAREIMEKEINNG